MSTKVHGVGTYIPTDKHKSTVNGKTSYGYTCWAGMLRRCYNEDSCWYKDCSVVEDWHRSDVFWEWADEQTGFGEKYYHLDKDILKIGNRIYGPDTCAFVPRQLNFFMCAANAIRGDTPQGIHWEASRSKYKVDISLDGKTKFLGRFSSMEDAKQTYAKAKDDEAQRWCARLKSNEFLVDEKVIIAMENYKFVYN